jgi:RNA polymerase sigma-70 factor (ECF subfamily)
MTARSREQQTDDDVPAQPKRLASGAKREAPEGALVTRAVAGAQRGDMEALHFLYARYAEDVLGYVRSIVQDHHEAEDITQNVFAKLITAIRRYEQREVPFKAWILRVARNAALDHMRSRRTTPCEEVRSDDDSAAHTDSQRSETLRDALAQLPDEQREVLVLRHVVGLSPTEIAHALGKTESSIHGLHHRGRRTLQTNLIALGAGPVVATT